ncbi:hypothetical protein [Bythopirellula polymerisocia]|uniref:Uncharacterized protein n=1 Tax=Bythopirellula polymerisocia TaxID=2528003 RepID=A0A5C6CXG2_9BACT|nr:hypothetical protein [Bythopirellula polymerisocia]TWU27319.1 hypothetical protein Pla144_20910 [Bythopirellula polymerisocia]
MSQKFTAQAILEREYLPVRAKIIEIASALDRIDRATGGPPDDPRGKQIQTALELLLENGPDRAERVQLLFSRHYDETWPATLQMPNR